MTRHECAVPGCLLGVPLSLLMCRDHWSMVPVDIQRAVYSAWRARLREGTLQNIRAHHEASDRAIAAVLARRERLEAERRADG